MASGVVLALFFAAIVRAPAMQAAAVGPKNVPELQTVQM
jgi:hypothetical protein